MLTIETIQELRWWFVEVHRFRIHDLSRESITDTRGEKVRLAQEPGLHFVNGEAMKEFFFLHLVLQLPFPPGNSLVYARQVHRVDRRSIKIQERDYRDDLIL